MFSEESIPKLFHEDDFTLVNCL